MYSFPEGFGLPALLLGGAFALFLAWLGYKAQRRPVRTGNRGMTGMTGVVIRRQGFRGRLIAEVRGEFWWCESTADIQPGMQVRVTGTNGLMLSVEPYEGSQGPTTA